MGQGRLAGDWKFVLFEDIQMEERGGKRKPKGMKDSWSVVQRGWEVGHGVSVREKEGGRIGQVGASSANRHLEDWGPHLNAGTEGPGWQG